MIANACNAIGYCDVRQSRATRECRTADTRNAIRYRDARKATATIERRRADARATCNHNRFQRGGNMVTIVRITGCTENVSKMCVFRTIFGGSYKRNRNVRQVTAILERRRSNARQLAIFVKRDARKVCTTTKCIIANARYAIGYRDTRQAGARFERIRVDARQLAVFAKREARKSSATRECIRADTRNAIGYCDTRQATATIECVISDACDTIRYRDARKATATIECIRADARATCNHNGFQRGGYRVSIVRIIVRTKYVSKMRIRRAIFGCSHKWNRNARQVTATLECRKADARYAIGNRDVRKATATMECRRADARYAIRNRDACKATAISERNRADARYTSWYRDVRQVTATLECRRSNVRQLAIFVKRDARKAYTTTKCIITNAHYTVGDRNALNTAAIVERKIADTRTICNHNGFQRGRNKAAIRKIRRCSKYVSKMRIFRTVFGCSHKWNRDTRQATATIERRFANAGNTIGYCDTRQATAIIERRITNDRHAIENFDALKATATRERIRANTCYAVEDRNALNTVASTERIIVDACTTCNHNAFQRGRNGITIVRVTGCTKYVSKMRIGSAVFGGSHKWYRNDCQTSAIVERTSAYTRYAIGNCNVRQICAIRKRKIADTCYAIGNRATRQTFTTVERKSIDAGNTIRNSKLGDQCSVQIQITGTVQGICISSIKRDSTPTCKIGNVYTCKTTAIIKRVRADAGYAIGDGNARKVIAITERLRANARTARNHNGFQRGGNVVTIVRSIG